MAFRTRAKTPMRQFHTRFSVRVTTRLLGVHESTDRAEAASARRVYRRSSIANDPIRSSRTTTAVRAQFHE